MERTVQNPQERLQRCIDNLSPSQLEQLADYAEYLHSKEEWEATQEILNDPGMKRDVDEGLEQIHRGETRSWRAIRNNVNCDFF